MKVRSSLCLVATSVVLSFLLAPAMLLAESYTFTFVATGSLNGVPFTDTAGTVTATSNTVTGPISGIFLAYAPSMLFSIDGVGAGAITDNPFVFLAPNPGKTTECQLYGCVGFGDDASDGPLMQLYSTSGIFKTYPLGTSIGPIPVLSPFSGGGSVDTNGGILEVSNMEDWTFTAASDTPEPSSILLLGTGLLGLARAMRRKKVIS